MRGRTALTTGILLGSALLIALASALEAQVGPRAPVPPAPPLLYVRLAGPQGMKVTLYRGEPTGVTLDTPCIVGLRPGYSYRVALSNIPGFSGVTFSPTLEVRGSFWLINQLRNSDFPATVLFQTEDFTKIEQGVLVKKIVVLERPDLAEPRATRAEEPLEIAVTTVRDLHDEVRSRGAALAFVYLGQRALEPEELAAAAVPGTLLLPGERTLPMPPVAPWAPWACYPVYDPLHGPPSPADYTALYDGGDSGGQAGFNRDGKLRGVDPTDTVADYVDARGRQRVVASNRVALCVPRFLIVRSESGLSRQTIAIGPGTSHVTMGGAVLHNRVPFVEHTQPLHLETTAARLKASGTQFSAGTAVTGQINGVEVAATLRAAGTLDGSHPPPTSSLPERPLRIIKWPDKRGANVGDVVTFSLQYTNHGSEPITNLAVTDNLTTRFEYVPGSQKADREATFILEANEVGSTRLRWEFPGALPAGEMGLITFQVRIR
jgi:uncharacterized repeat protein (TIGR01451 family)